MKSPESGVGSRSITKETRLIDMLPHDPHVHTDRKLIMKNNRKWVRAFQNFLSKVTCSFQLSWNRANSSWRNNMLNQFDTAPDTTYCNLCHGQKLLCFRMVIPPFAWRKAARTTNRFKRTIDNLWLFGYRDKMKKQHANYNIWIYIYIYVKPPSSHETSWSRYDIKNLWPSQRLSLNLWHHQWNISSLAGGLARDLGWFPKDP